MYHFSKRIKCADCGKNYKGLKERRERIVYICAGYSNYGKEFCAERWKVDQDMLINLLQRHYDITLIKTGQVVGENTRKPVEWIPVPMETLVGRVEIISISPKQQTIHIRYTDGTSTLFEPKHTAYWTDQV